MELSPEFEQVRDFDVSDQIDIREIKINFAQN